MPFRVLRRLAATAPYSNPADTADSMRCARHWSSTSWAPGAKAAAHRGLGARDTVTVLGVALSRIYTLRNQLMHGGATWGSSVNRDQIRDCVGLMGKLVPLVIEIMLDHPGTLWCDACYPMVD